MEEHVGLWELLKRVFKRLGLYPLAAWLMWQIRRLRYWAQDRLHTLKKRYNRVMQPVAEEQEALPPNGYDVLCLPVIPWASRFQRPQQLMQQLAEREHRIFYASLEFHGGSTARLRPLGEKLFEIALPGVPGTSVYRQLPTAEQVQCMAAAVDALRADARITSAVIVVQLPFWTALAERLRADFGWPVIYDCMDDHAGFSTNSPEMLAAEERTIAAADLVVVTSVALEEKVRPRAQRTALIRNACDYEHFATASSSNACSPRATVRQPDSVTVGFYGAIAEWFDNDLVADLAEMRPQWRFELIGSTFTGDVSRLQKLPNVTLLGEKPYAELPRLIADWDCFIIPFRRIPLTEATNPVKAYEMLATGKPVVAVNLPELRPMATQKLVALADDAPGFAAAIQRAVHGDCAAQSARRQSFAAENTWKHRCDALENAACELFPLASIIVVTYNNLHLNQACLNSLWQTNDYPNFEVIVVDNASSDGTAEWLTAEAARQPRLKLIRNRENRGFAAANNQALRIANGEFLCLLNNDTVVTHGWLAKLIGHLRRNSRLGLIGPVSNMVGNEAIVPVEYQDIADMPRWAERYCRQHDGQTVPMEMLGFFCVVMPRAVYEQVGELDEQFGLGYFEDDDYCRRVRELGYELCFARDAFVHHFHSSSFKLLGPHLYQQVFEENRRKYQRKWQLQSMAGAF